MLFPEQMLSDKDYYMLNQLKKEKGEKRKSDNGRNEKTNGD